MQLITFVGYNRLKDALLALRFAADEGQPEAAYALGNFLRENLGKEYMYEMLSNCLFFIWTMTGQFRPEILELFTIAADVGHPKASLDILTCEPRSYESALNWACGILQRSKHEVPWDRRLAN